MATGNTFRIPEPESLQTFGGQGVTPFGNPIGYEPPLARPVVMPAGQQPKFVLKIDVTPVKPAKQEPDTPVKYVVSGAGVPEPLSVTDEKIVSHTIPQISKLATETIAVSVQPEDNFSGGQAPRTFAAVYPDGRSMTTAQVIPGRRVAGSEEGVFLVQPGQSEGGATAPAAPPKSLATSNIAYSRSLARPLPELEEDEQKMYAWIEPAGDELVVEEEVVSRGKSFEEARRRKIKKNVILAEDERPFLTRLCHPQKQMVTRIERHADSWEMMEGSPEEEPIEEEEVEEDDGLVRPSVVYGGAEVMPPKYAGKLPPKSWKVHAVEVHQYIPVPGVEPPPLLSMGLNPFVEPIHGAVPLPFDPECTGMSAITLQNVIKGVKVPKLAPAMTELFTQEVPAMFSTDLQGQIQGIIERDSP